MLRTINPCLAACCVHALRNSDVDGFGGLPEISVSGSSVNWQPATARVQTKMNEFLSIAKPPIAKTILL
jgi:hypothetical protein